MEPKAEMTSCSKKVIGQYQSKRRLGTVMKPTVTVVVIGIVVRGLAIWSIISFLVYYVSEICQDDTHYGNAIPRRHGVALNEGTLIPVSDISKIADFFSWKTKAHI